MGRKFIDLTGQHFGKVTVFKRKGKSKEGEILWLCHCECGNITTIRGNKLRSGHTQSCGCLRGEKHGLSKTRLYHIWQLLKDRCYNPNSLNYSYCGSRNIEVCEEWLKSFVSFYDWALENGYREDLTIDRIDNNAGYSPENCHWATWIEQENNRRNNHHLTIDDDMKTISEWSRTTGINRSTMESRLGRGLSGKELIKSAGRYNIHLTIGGITKTIIEWSRSTGINKKTIYSRLARDWSEESILKNVLKGVKS